MLFPKSICSCQVISHVWAKLRAMLRAAHINYTAPHKVALFCCVQSNQINYLSDYEITETVSSKVCPCSPLVYVFSVVDLFLTEYTSAALKHKVQY